MDFSIDRMSQEKFHEWGSSLLRDMRNRTDETQLTVKVPTVNFDRWIALHARQQDHVVLKMDVEGAEFSVLRKMILSRTFCLVDELRIETHGRFGLSDTVRNLTDFLSWLGRDESCAVTVKKWT